MASTFTTGLSIEKMGNGDQSNTWGTTTNQNWDRVDAGVAWQVVSTLNFSTNQANVIFLLPSKYVQFRIEWQNLAGAFTSYLRSRVSVDGTTYSTGSTDYQSISEVISTSAATPTVANGAASSMITVGSHDTSGGSMTIHPGIGFVMTESFYTQTNIPGIFRSHNKTVGAIGTLAAVQLYFTDVSLTPVSAARGRLRLLGALS